MHLQVNNRKYMNYGCLERNENKPYIEKLASPRQFQIIVLEWFTERENHNIGEVKKNLRER